MHVGILPECLYLHQMLAVHVEASREPLGLELQTVVGYLVGAGDLTQVL